MCVFFLIECRYWIFLVIDRAAILTARIGLFLL